ncbi:MAG: hypothetical protein V1752_05890 [Candidatus Firestonebacteria bacterium]
MLKKSIKILQAVIAGELAILLIIVFNACSSSTPLTPVNNFKSPVIMKSFGEIGTAEVANIEMYEMTIKGITLIRDDNTRVSLWSGSTSVDLAATSYNSTLPITGTLPADSYKAINLSMSSTFRVKGSLNINGTPYYTKTSHSGWNTGSAEVEELSINTMSSGDTYTIEQAFSTSKQLGGTINSMQFLVDLGGNLMYYSGVGDPPHPAITVGMNLYGMSAAVVFGTAGTVESYKISNISNETDPSKSAGRYVFIFDGNDEVIGVTTKFSFEDGKRGTGLYANGVATVTKNSNGTLKLVMTGDLNGGPYVHTFDSFTRATHTGSFTTTMLGVSSPNGTYTATLE